MKDVQFGISRCNEESWFYYRFIDGTAEPPNIFSLIEEILNKYGPANS